MSKDVFQGGATTSQHVDAENDDHFENTTFKLKRTRSLGLLDEFIDPQEQEKIIQLHNQQRHQPTVEDVAGSPLGDLDADPHPAQDKSPSPVLDVVSPELLPHDDTDLTTEPSLHVDYLSHQWDVFDISKSWRYVISKRKDVANSARLENASWRTWAQRRCNLKTISPEVVNWLKDLDVTWLYGPILKDADGFGNSSEDDHKRETIATSAVAGDISIADKSKKGPKPILKRRTVEDMIISHSNLLKLQRATSRMEDMKGRLAAANRENDEAKRKAEATPEYFDVDAISSKLNSQYKNFSAASSANNSLANLPGLAALANASTTSLKDRLNQLVADKKAQASLRPTLALKSAEKVLEDKSTRHIHFNEVVQQCIAVDEYSDDNDEYDDSNDEDYYYDSNDDDEGYIYEPNNENDNLFSGDEDEDDDDGGFFLNVKSPSNVPGVPALASSTHKDSNDFTEDTESISTNNSKIYRTILLLPSTTINYGSSAEESDEENPYTSSLSHNINNSARGYDYFYDYNTVYTVDPKHAIYGSASKDDKPDVVDVPDNIALGSSFDYDIIENDDFSDSASPAPQPRVDYSALFPQHTYEDEHQLRLPLLSLDDSKKIDSSDSDLDSDDGLSILARNSSQSLAQLVFGALTSTEKHFPEAPEQQPAPNHMSEVNPRYLSLSSISRQPHSSGSLKDSFFTGGLTKQRPSSALLADQFFNVSDTVDTSNLSTASSYVTAPSPSCRPTGLSTQELQKKSLPLPPYVNSAHAFSSSPPDAHHPRRNTFLFDSESESEDEFVEDNRDSTSYASLAQVADRNGIKSPSPDSDLVGRTKEIASHLLHWNQKN